MILDINNSETFISNVTENLTKSSVKHQLTLMALTAKLNFYNTFTTDTKLAEFLNNIKSGLDQIKSDIYCLM